MNNSEFRIVFKELTGNVPLRWQERLFQEHFFKNNIRRVIDLPTGLGKTMVMAIWLISRAVNTALPRRLIYVVDRRTVVDQATDLATSLKENASAALPALANLTISTLRGQLADNREWTRDPSRPAIIFKYSLATHTHGGILVNGDIQQEALINLVALRTLTSDLMTKRYLLGLALVGLSYRDQEGFNLREGCLLCAASKLDLDGKWKVVNFDGTDSPVTLTHDAALAYAQASATDFKVEQPAMADEFDKAVAEEWIEIEKKERKAIAKRMHPGAAIAERRKKAAQDDANDPLGALLKLVNAVSLGRKPAKSKPRVIKRQAFNAVEKWCKELQSADVEDSIKTLARELLNSIENDTDSHVTKDSMKEKIGSLQNPTTESAAPNTESTVGNSEAVE